MTLESAAGVQAPPSPHTIGFEDRGTELFSNSRLLPWSPGNFEGGVGVLARACGFVCEFIPARLVEC